MTIILRILGAIFGWLKNILSVKLLVAILFFIVLSIFLLSGYCGSTKSEGKKTESKKTASKSAVSPHGENQLLTAKADLVLKAVEACYPDEFNTEAKTETAIARYRRDGLIRWMDQIKCWETHVTEDMLPFNLAIFNVNTSLTEISTPYLSIDRVITERISEGPDCKVKEDSGKTYNCDEKVKNPFSRKLVFWSSGPTAKIKVVVRKQ